MVKALINSLLVSLSALFSFICIFLIRAMIRDGVSALYVSYVAVLVTVIVLLLAVAHLSTTPSSIDECKLLYKDVAWMTRRWILAIGFFTLLFYYLSAVVAWPSDYNTQYPKARQYLTESAGLSESHLRLVECFPRWFVGYFYSSADNLQNVIDVIKDTELSADEIEKQIDAIADIIDEEEHQCKVDALLCIIFLYLGSVLHMVSVRIQQYHTYMRRLTE